MQIYKSTKNKESVLQKTWKPGKINYDTFEV